MSYKYQKVIKINNKVMNPKAQMNTKKKERNNRKLKKEDKMIKVKKHKNK